MLDIATFSLQNKTTVQHEHAVCLKTVKREFIDIILELE